MTPQGGEQIAEEQLTPMEPIDEWAIPLGIKKKKKKPGMY